MHIHNKWYINYNKNNKINIKVFHFIPYFWFVYFEFKSSFNFVFTFLSTVLFCIWKIHGMGKTSNVRVWSRFASFSSIINVSLKTSKPVKISPTSYFSKLNCDLEFNSSLNSKKTFFQVQVHRITLIKDSILSSWHKNMK